MQRFWSSHIEPLLRAAAPKRILEITRGGAVSDEVRTYAGWNDAEAAGASSADGIASPADFLLRDGDPNWHSVYRELSALAEQAAAAKTALPVFVFHNAGWPYARRDSYDDPRRIDPEFRQEHSYRPVMPGQSELGEGGVFAMRANAVREGGPRNGVLKAVEDFTAEWPGDFDLRVLPVFQGLGVCVPQARMTPALGAVIDGFFSAEGLRAACEALEAERFRLEAELDVERLRLARRTEALERAREILADPKRKP
jgi:hypothetical protein